jgi:hypothetical protein
MGPHKSVPLLALVLIGLALPSFGPMLDHHFAERQPGHRHLGPAVSHVHGYDNQVEHHHPAAPGGHGPTAFYSYDASPPAISFAVVDDQAQWSTLLFMPSSVFVIPDRVDAQPSGHVTAPPGKPPPRFA